MHSSEPLRCTGMALVPLHTDASVCTVTGVSVHIDGGAHLENAVERFSVLKRASSMHHHSREPLGTVFCT
jgi:hypothetical protein